jgi:penicillin-binding protein 2
VRPKEPSGILGILDLGECWGCALLVTFLFWTTPTFGAAGLPSGKVCDRNGVVLIEVETDANGGAKLDYPLGALGAQMLRGLDPAVLPRNGDTLHLTIDVQAQLAAENALRKIHRGCAVVMDSMSGDILAMASVPSFDPNNPDLATLEADPTEPLRNRALSANASPAATFLPITMLAGLAAGLRDFQHECTGVMQVDGRPMRCWINARGNPGAHGKQTFRDGMRNSCNIFFYQLGIAAGPEKICSVAMQLGLGKQTGIPVRDEEAGIVPNTEWLKKHYPKEEWSAGSTARLAIGQGYLLATPLQMTAMAGTIGNGGIVTRPRLIDRIVHADGRVSRPEATKEGGLDEVGILKGDVEVVRKAMIAVVNDSGGTGSRAATPDFVVGGRTGTSQFWRQQTTRDNNTAFVAFAESEKGHYAVGVFVEGAQSGGGVAAPLASKILANLEVPVPPEKLKPLEPAKGSLDFVGSVE